MDFLSACCLAKFLFLALSVGTISSIFVRTPVSDWLLCFWSR